MQICPAWKGMCFGNALTHAQWKKTCCYKWLAAFELFVGDAARAICSHSQVMKLNLPACPATCTTPMPPNALGSPRHARSGTWAPRLRQNGREWRWGSQLSRPGLRCDTTKCWKWKTISLISAHVTKKRSICSALPFQYQEARRLISTAS